LLGAEINRTMVGIAMRKTPLLLALSLIINLPTASAQGLYPDDASYREAFAERSAFILEGMAQRTWEAGVDSRMRIYLGVVKLATGIDADTGQAPGVAVRATATLTLGLPKVGLAREHAGDLWLADLGIPPGVYARAGVVVPALFGNEARLRLRYPSSVAEDGGER